MPQIYVFSWIYRQLETYYTISLSKFIIYIVNLYTLNIFISEYIENIVTVILGLTAYVISRNTQAVSNYDEIELR